MKRTIVSLLLAVALLVPFGVGRPQAASADCSDHSTWVDIITFGLACAITPFGVSLPYSCPLQQVDVTAPSGKHIYKFGLACSATEQIQASAAYDPSNHNASEKLTGEAGTLEATWTCSDDPWIYLPGRVPTCVSISAESNPNTGPLQISNLIFPFSASPLSDASRQTLNAQLQNAIHALQAPPSSPVTPALFPNAHTLSPTCLACNSTPAVVLPSAHSVSPNCLACQQADAHAPAIVNGWPQLSLGSQGQAVTSLQYLLQANGAAPSVNGQFDAATDTAVRAYQQAHGLTVDGVVGAQTWQAIIVTLQQGSQGPAVKAVQSQLASRGVAITVDGQFGPATDTAVRSYQQAQGLTVDGIVGLQTWQALLDGR